MEYLKYIGLVIILIGVAVLVTPFLMGITGNISLFVGFTTIVVGFVGFVILNRFVR